MKLQIRAGLLASALILGAAPFVADAALNPAAAAQFDVSFRSFHNQLARQGDWVYSDRWGEVWLPSYVDADWRPYSNGYWANTDEYGWLWVSDDEGFGDITSHYGRWVNDPYDGWMWVPGYVWSPAWVVWRRSGDYTGWMPMPPDQRFLAGEDFGGSSFGISIGGLSISFNNWGSTDGYYGYSRWYGRSYSRDRFNAMWTFVPVRHFADRDYRRYTASRRDLPKFLRKSTNITNYTVVNNYIVNRSVNEQNFRGVDFKSFHRVKAADVVRQPAASVDRGRDEQKRMHDRMPRGTGLNNSAPKPTQEQVQSLSVPTDAKAQERAKRRAARLLSRDGAAVVARPDNSAPTPLTPADSMKAQNAATDKKDKAAGASTATPATDAADKAKNKKTDAPDTTPAGTPASDTTDKVKNKKPDTSVTPASDATDKVKNKKTDSTPNATPVTTDAPKATPSTATPPPAATNAPGTEDAKAARRKARHDAAAAAATPTATPTTPATTPAPAAAGATPAEPAATDQSGEKKKKKKHPADTTTPGDTPQ